MIRNALAKINLSLEVGPKAANGYHTINSLILFADLGETVRLQPAETNSAINLNGPQAHMIDRNAPNLVAKAQHWFEAITGEILHCTWQIHKTIPVAAGLGGGSSDAAAALHLMEQMSGRQLNQDELQRLATELGSDIPACYHGQAARIEGNGEIIKPRTAPPCYLVLASPMVALSTRLMFEAFDNAFPAPRPIARDAHDNHHSDMLLEARQSRNDFQDLAIQACPAIGTILNMLIANPTCKLARLSGSGAACFGLFEQAESAKQAARSLPCPWVAVARAQ